MNQHKSNGFTLIELFITLLVLAVVVTLAVPPFADFLERQRLSAQAEAISSTLSTARA
ncbi:MAG: type IV fimbrial biogenesis protein FimT, partial [Arenicella sp.]